MSELNDKWIYDKLEQFKPEDELDMRTWYNTVNGPRWRGMGESVLDKKDKASLYSKFGKRFPKSMTDEMLYLTDRLLDITRKIHPCFETILFQHTYAEGFLYADLDLKKYREHIIHPFKVAVIARWLLEESGNINEIKKNLKKNKKIKELLTYLHLSDSVFDEKENKIIKCALWLPGLFHDIGYFHYLFNRIEDHIKQLYPFYKGDVAGVSVAGINTLIIKRSLVWQYLMDENLKENHDPWKGGVYNNLWKNHSVAGAIAFIHFYQEILDHWDEVDPRMLLVFELAAEAIFLHDLSKTKNFNGELKIQFNTQPLAIILILADELQDWGRPRISYKQDGFTDTVNMEFKYKDKVEYQLDNSKKPVILRIPKAKAGENERVYDKIGKLNVFGDSSEKVFKKFKKFIQIETL
ncbi:MAG: hypothetical protein JXJ04_18935 [Spirochaetales bacterium]|nr:hypothetical protein [Spirochaetales bacterium]